MIMQEAVELSAINSELTSRGVPLYGILHEEHGAEDFKQYLNGDLFLDEKVWQIESSTYCIYMYVFHCRKCFMVIELDYQVQPGSSQTGIHIDSNTSSIL